jgi:hypothetical protein
MAFTPQPSDEADAKAPLLVAVTELTTCSDVADVVFRTLAVAKLSPVMTALGEVDVPAVKPIPPPVPRDVRDGRCRMVYGHADGRS